jgi:hypothetical protein
VIGKVKEVFLWSNKPPQKYRPIGPRPKQVDPVLLTTSTGTPGSAPPRNGRT